MIDCTRVITAFEPNTEFSDEIMAVCLDQTDQVALFTREGAAHFLLSSDAAKQLSDQLARAAKAAEEAE